MLNIYINKYYLINFRFIDHMNFKAYGTTVKFTNRTRTTVKFPTVKYNIRDYTNREIIINICIIWIYITYIYL